ncbi:hypothetical protein AB6A40_008347 [Gnathostoma spinigerum]|uniref:Fucosyltransferase N-terminal domain-containing protein n=1 Tax=Gnathostoma spinigerum TaxID=75299 RepID=A0ABD6ENV1_9BILA
MGLPMFLMKKFPNVMPPQRRIRALLGICIVILFAVIHFIFVFREQTGRDSHVYSGRKHSSLRTKNIKNETKKKTFIIWTGVFGEKKMDVLIDCPLKDQCRQVYDRNLVSTVDAVLIHLPDINASDVPAKKYMGQKYVLFMMEVPTNLRYHIQRFPGTVFLYT